RALQRQRHQHGGRRQLHRGAPRRAARGLGHQRDAGPAAGRARAFGVGPSVRYMNDRGWRRCWGRCRR
ncbi:hypothetical protein FGX01_06135, partial [Xylella fastidiosa subsp. multiplex]|nr:hypothetical protein [Xylella fastidiosa subsp. multiplex]